MWVLLMDQTIDNKEDEVRSELVWCSKRTVAYGKTSEPWLGNYLLGMAFGVVLNGLVKSFWMISWRLLRLPG